MIYFFAGMLFMYVIMFYSNNMLKRKYFVLLRKVTEFRAMEEFLGPFSLKSRTIRKIKESMDEV